MLVLNNILGLAWHLCWKLPAAEIVSLAMRPCSEDALKSAFAPIGRGFAAVGRGISAVGRAAGSAANNFISSTARNIGRLFAWHSDTDNMCFLSHLPPVLGMFSLLTHCQ